MMSLLSSDSGGAAREASLDVCGVSASSAAGLGAGGNVG